MSIQWLPMRQMGLFLELNHAFLDLDPYLPCILGTSSRYKAIRDCHLADGPCRDLRGLGANVETHVSQCWMH